MRDIGTPRDTPARLWLPAAGLILCALCLHAPWPGRPLHRLSDFCSHTLYQSFIALAAILLLWRGGRGPLRRVLWWPVAVALATPLCVETLKRLTRWTRPDGEPTGFPSGHTTFMFALAWLLCHTYPRLTPLWFGLAVAVGWARVEGSAHFPYQVLCGAALGTVIGWGITHGPLGGRKRGGRQGTSDAGG